jgi:hypothetical protein
MRIVRGYTDHGTFGKWYDAEAASICHSLEYLWKDNIPYISCVPEGVYQLVEHNSPKYGDTFALLNHALDVGVMKGDALRWGCLIHAANWMIQLQGCIAPGTSLGVLGGKWAVTGSRNARKRIFALIEAGDRTLEITHATGVL